MGQDNFLDALPIGSRLHWYALERVLGQGGFGITYLARDNNLAKTVAIKEYLPVDVALRGADDVVKPRTDAHGERYRWGLDRFIEEARTLARFDHPNIVRVHSVFEANGTAYMVMRFEEGDNLAVLLERRGVLPEPELLRIVLPILDGLEVIHRAGFIHRDIKPENIHVRDDGSPVLLDFGSARQSIGSAKTMTVLIAPGYAPIEQYYGEAGAQGPWTDIYGMGATCYRAIAGEAPRDAIARTKGVLGSSRETMAPAISIGRGRYSPQLLAAVDHALQLEEGNRPQTVSAWRREIVAGEPVAPPRAAASASGGTWTRPRTIAWIAGACVLMLSVGSIGWWMTHRDPVESTQAGAVDSPSPVSATTSPTVPATTTATVDAKKSDVAATMQPAEPPPALREEPVAAAATASEASSRREEMRPLKPAATDIRAPAPTSAAATVKPGPTKLAASAATTGTASVTPATSVAATATGTAESGDARAQLQRGATKESGRGPAQSLFEAYVWYSLAARQGQPGADAARQRVASRLQAAEIHQADRVVERWRPTDTPIDKQGNPP